MNQSYATTRKVRIIESHAGSSWRETYQDRSIDSVYNEIVGDRRKTLFAKISPEIKDMLDQMTAHYDTSMAELIETLIQNEYDSFTEKRASSLQSIADSFSGEETHG